MLQSFKQFVYCGTGSNRNNINAETLINGINNYAPIVQLGVQAPPGTKFYINGNTEPVIIGSTGLFSIDLRDNGSISEIRFDRNSVNAIGSNDRFILIVDIAYLAGGEE